MGKFDFLKLPFFNKTYNINATLNQKFAKSVSVLSLALISVSFSLIMVAFIFFGGLQKFVPELLLSHDDIRNLFLCIVHTFAALFAILYASFFIDKKRYDGKIVSPAIITVIIFAINLFLTWRCFIKNDLDILVYIMTADGAILSTFFIFLSILQYDVTSKKTSKRHFASTFVRVLSIVSLFMYLFAIFTYYDYFSHMLTLIAHTNLSGFQTDALVLFLYMIADVCLIITISLMIYLEKKLNAMLKDFTRKVRKKTQNPS